ncbi:right-handed parallel beta-helix repeat-containing protein [Yersinia vastinensis]|uniref:right-handed parallel beta-helix repeat-containing protein n=1 Tax=Yersinia vastinensis TaxID=2890318 RepID=UPI00384C56A3
MTDGGGNARITISGNIVNGGGTATGQGIFVANSTSVIVVDNQVSNFLDHGIYTDVSSSGTVINGNEVTGCASGIRAFGNHNIISNNTCFLNNTTGIRITGSYGSVTNNTCKDNALTASSYGLEFAGGSLTTINGNSVYDTRDTKLQSGFNTVVADRLIVTGNMFYPNYAINMGGTGALTNSVVANNISA